MKECLVLSTLCFFYFVAQLPFFSWSALHVYLVGSLCEKLCACCHHVLPWLPQPVRVRKPAPIRESSSLRLSSFSSRPLGCLTRYQVLKKLRIIMDVNVPYTCRVAALHSFWPLSTPCFRTNWGKAISKRLNFCNNWKCSTLLLLNLTFASRPGLNVSFHPEFSPSAIFVWF